ncbi:hypothetical protein AVO43_08040 [Microbulbifer sp. ZGT114]|nr:hypothetical protein AVO43_08040 [Microbulbifer sp. ZGT114]
MEATIPATRTTHGPTPIPQVASTSIILRRAIIAIGTIPGIATIIATTTIVVIVTIAAITATTAARVIDRAGRHIARAMAVRIARGAEAIALDRM